MLPRIIKKIQIEDCTGGRILYGALGATKGATLNKRCNTGITAVHQPRTPGSVGSRLAGYGLHIPQSGNDQ